MLKKERTAVRSNNRREFLQSVGIGAAGLVGDAALTRTFGAPALTGSPGHLPQAEYLRRGFADLRREVAAKRRVRKNGRYQTSVQDLADLIEDDGVVRMYVTEMIDQVADTHKTIHDVQELLDTLDYIVGKAPEFNIDPKKHSAFPVSRLFLHMMYTPAGIAAFRNRAFNEAVRKILKAWCQFLDSSGSRIVLNPGENGWLSPASYKLNRLDEFVIPDKSAPHGGFESFNAFFHRKIKPEARPIASPDNPKVVVSANDGTVYRISRNVKRVDRFWIKSQPYSLTNILDGHPSVDRFVGGDVFQSFLGGSDYHRWHAPIGGTVVDTRIVEGLMYSELHSEGLDPTAGTYSQGYQASVNTRGLVFIESDDPRLGLVCVVPIGITEVSSVTNEVRPGQKIRKGDEIGYFSYGGSSMCLIFQPGAIRNFTVEALKSKRNPDEGPTIRVNAQIAFAN